MRALALLGCSACLWLSGCGDSAAAQSGAAEPLRVSNGQFFEGDFPAPTGGPAIDAPNSIRNGTVVAGITGKKIGGLTSGSALGVALKLAGLGHGYWVVPVGSIDLTEGKPAWSATCDFSRDIPAGSYALNVAATDRQGRVGSPASAQLQFLSFAPKGHVVASLTWGNDADLDLHIVSPSGKELDPKHPSTATLDENGDAVTSGAGTLDGDSNAGCIADGNRGENVVWDTDAKDPPEAGTYFVRVDMFSACGRPGATFKFTLTVDGEPVKVVDGQLLDTDADNGGPGSGLFVTQFTL